MYEHKTSQISFILPFSGELSPHNRWVQLAHLIPWDEVEKKYQEHFPSKKGAPAKPARMALGALIIKEMLQTSDEWSGSRKGHHQKRKWDGHFSLH